MQSTTEWVELVEACWDEEVDVPRHTDLERWGDLDEAILASLRTPAEEEAVAAAVEAQLEAEAVEAAGDFELASVTALSFSAEEPVRCVAA